MEYELEDDGATLWISRKKGNIYEVGVNNGDESVTSARFHKATLRDFFLWLSEELTSP